jgi:lysylphosphatidylglycerol synthetase-like protein (DUF2156 family)
VRTNRLRTLAAFVAAVAVATLAAAAGSGWARDGAAGLAGLFIAARPRPAVGVLLAVVLLVLAHGVAGGRRLAWRLLVGLALAGLVVRWLARPGLVGDQPARWVVGVAVLTVLLAVRGDLPVRPHPRRLRAAAVLALCGLAVTVARGGWLAGAAGDSPVRSARLALSPGGTGAVLALLAVVGLAVALAPAPAPPAGTATERARVLALAAHPDADSLAPFAARADRSYAFSPDGRAVIGYRVLCGVALVGGDPVGERASVGAAIAVFLDTCRRNGWRPAVLGASAPVADRWREHGLGRGVVIGDEAVLDTATFTLESRRMRNVRQSVQRTGNAGVTVHIGQLSVGELAGLAPVQREWLHGRGERGFAMNLGWVLQPRPDCLFAVAYDRTGAPQAFARFARCAAGRVLTLDVAPRRTGAPNGVVERLIVEVVGYGRRHGVTEVSLNFAGLRGVYAGCGPAARTGAALAHLFDGWIKLRPLYRFTAKFHPRWHPRRLLMSSWLDIFRVGTAALRAEFVPTRLTGPEQAGRLPLPTPRAH